MHKTKDRILALYSINKHCVNNIVLKLPGEIHMNVHTMYFIDFKQKTAFLTHEEERGSGRRKAASGKLPMP